MGRIRLTDRVTAARAERAAADAVRTRRVVEARDGAKVLIDGHQLVSFCSNDYLGLSQHLDVVAALQEGAAWHGVGSTGSPGVSGHHGEHAAFEREMAQWLGYERALLFGSGYQANLAVLQSLLGEGDTCVQDKLNHACLIDGARLSGAELKRYPHGDVEAALRQLMSRREGAAILATDGVFSMDGDRAPLADLALVARTQDATLYVDDAHGIGVMGPEGRGSLAVAGLGAREVPLLLVPLGKAFGGQGAVLLGSAAMVGHVAETARPYLFSTAPAPAMAAAMRASLRLIRAESWRRAKLAMLVARFRRGASSRGLPLQESFTPIQPIIVGDNARALAMSAALEARGYLVSAIRPPTVPEGQARLRVTLSVDHAEADVDGLLTALADGMKAAPAKIPGMTLFHEVRGQGPDLVLLHGWGMHAGIFAPLAQKLEGHFTLHLLDLPGHGRSGGSGIPLTLADAAAQVAAQVPARALWLGWSLGGLVALHAAATQPARVRGLVMVAASPRFVRAYDWPQGMPNAVFHGFAENLRSDYRGTLDRFLLLEAQGSERMREELRTLRTQAFAHGEPPAGVLCDGLEILESADLRAALPTLAMPSLWLAGRRDRLVSPEAMQAAVALAPGASFHQVGSGGHAPFLTQAGEVADAVATFADGCPA